MTMIDVAETEKTTKEGVAVIEITMTSETVTTVEMAVTMDDMNELTVTGEESTTEGAELLATQLLRRALLVTSQRCGLRTLRPRSI